MGLALPADHIVKIKESKKGDKYLDLARELKKLWNMMMMMILIVIGALRTIPKGLVKKLEYLEIRGHVETIQIAALSRLAKITRRVQETWGYSLLLKLLWKTIR